MLRAIFIGVIYWIIADITKYYKMDNELLHMKYGDHFCAKKDNEIIVVSLNINSLQTESWRAKNDLVRDFILKSEVDIIALQEVNIN